MNKNVKKTKTISFGSVKEYAQVKDRLLAFREECPNGIIDTNTEMHGTNAVLKATISTCADESDSKHRKASGQAFGEIKGKKGFEKLETIAVGRALANLGYLADGAIASSEEMEDYLQYQTQTNKERELLIVEMLKTEDVNGLKDFFLNLEPKHSRHKEMILAKNKHYNELKLVEIEK